MKILKAIMLTLLISLCVTVATVVAMHIFGGDSDGAQPRERIRNNTESEAADVSAIDEPIIEPDEFRFLQRGATRSQETGYLQYYPIIPWDALPGETVVLSVSAEGFKGWEADPYFAPVELFDEKTDRENAYVSFIMPDGRVSIAALYEDSIPCINYENTQNMVSAMKSMFEQGSADIVPASTGIVPRPGPPFHIEPPLILNQQVTIGFDNPDIPPITDPLDPNFGKQLCWHWNFPSPSLDGFSWEHAAGGGGIITAEPVNVGGHRPFSVTIRYCDHRTTAPHTPGEMVDTYLFTISIIRQTGVPDVKITDEIPDAMEGVWYSVPFEVSDFAGTRWIWNTIGGDTGLPTNSGLSVWHEADFTRWFIGGTPTEAAAGQVYDFIINFQQTYPNTSIVEDSNELSLKVWPKLNMAPDNETVLLPGIANINGVSRPYNMDFDMTPNNHEPIPITVSYTGVPANNPLDPMFRPNANWTWDVSPNSKDQLPAGLRIESVGTPGHTARIVGVPTVPGVRDVTIRYEANRSVLIGWIERTYRIEILAPPWIGAEPGTETITLEQGMEDRPPTPAGDREPKEPDQVGSEWYRDQFGMAGLPIGTSWTWRVVPSASADPPVTLPNRYGVPEGLWIRPDPFPLTPSPTPLTTARQIPVISTGGTTYSHPLVLYGIPEHNAKGDYIFDIELECADLNPNIRGAKITQRFEIRIWPRTYLHVSGLGSINNLYVRRYDDFPGEPDWVRLGPSTPTGELRPWEGKRAVMPGTRAIISTNSSGSFVRWDISHSFDNEGINLSPLGYSAGSNAFFRNGGIGGERNPPGSAFVEQTGYGIHAGTHAFVVIEMPLVSMTDNGDVFIRAAQLGRDGPNMTGVPRPGRHALAQGVEGGRYEATIEIDSEEIGSGPGAMRWQVIPNPDPLPLGLSIAENAFDRTVIGRRVNGVPEIALREGLSEFTVRMTFPGSMIIERDFSIFINPWDGLGDVNDDGVVDLRDLVLLVRYQRDKSLSVNMNMRNARLSTSGQGTHDPGLADIDLLASYFTHSQGSFRP